MPNSTLTAMTSASALTGTELFYSVQGGADRKVTSSQIYTYVTTVSTFGGVTASSAPPHQFANQITAAGALLYQQPAFSDISGVAASSQVGLGPFTAGQIIYASSATTAGGMSGTTWNDANRALTITGSSNLTTNNPILNLSQTWNSSSVTFTGLNLNISNTASLAGSKLFDVQLTSASALNVDVNKTVAIGGAETTSGGFPIGLSVAQDLGTDWGTVFTGYGNNNFNYAMWFRKTKGTVPSSHVIVGANSELFVMSFQGSNGTAFQEAASIDVWVDGTPLPGGAGVASMPGRMDFVTNPGITGSLVRLSIDSKGNTWLRTAGVPSSAPSGATACLNGVAANFSHASYGGI